MRRVGEKGGGRGGTVRVLIGKQRKTEEEREAESRKQASRNLEVCKKE